MLRPSTIQIWVATAWVNLFLPSLPQGKGQYTQISVWNHCPFCMVPFNPITIVGDARTPTFGFWACSCGVGVPWTERIAEEWAFMIVDGGQPKQELQSLVYCDACGCTYLTESCNHASDRRKEVKYGV
jgi:hypothetical protein